MDTAGQTSARELAALKERITGRLSGRSFSLSPEMLEVPAIEAVLRGLFEDGWLRIEDAELASTDDTTLTVSGRATVFRVPNALVTATFHLGDEPALVLGVTGFPTWWTLSASFPGMAGTLLDSVTLRNPVLTVDSRNPTPLEENFQVALGLPPNTASLEKYLLRGLYFQAEVDLGALNAVAWLLEGQRLQVHGPMELKGDVVRTWLRSDTLSPFEAGGFSLPFEVQLISWFEEASTPRTFARLASSATWKNKGSSFTLPLAAMVDDPAMDELTLEAGLEDLSHLAFAELSRAMGAADLMGQLGDSFPSLDDVTLQRVAVTTSRADSSISRFEVAIRLEKTVALIPGQVSLGGFTLRFTLVQPGTAQSRLYAGATLDARLFGARFTGHMTLPRGRFSMALDAGESIELASLVEELLPEVKGPPLRCQDFRVYGSLGESSLSMYVELDGAWRIPIGITGLTVEQLVLNMEHDRAGGQTRTQGFVGGDVQLGDDILISALWQVPGGLFLRGTIAELQLLDVVEKLCGGDVFDGLPVARELLGVGLSDATVTADFRTNTFSLGASADKLGRAELFVEKPSGGGWGLGLGLYLSSDIRFKKLSPVLAPLDGFRISNPYLVLSTFQARELALPDQPKQYATRMQRGVNMYLPIQLEPKGALASLKSVLGEDGASLVLSGAFTDQGCRLEASMAGFQVARGVDFESAGFRVAIEPDGDLSLSVFGRISVKLRDPLQFSGELLLQPNGAMLSATMEGTWHQPFGIPGFVLSDVALALGLSLQGLPTLGLAGKAVIGGTEGSFAVLLNSVDPAESVLSMRFDELSLSVLLGAAVSPEVRGELPDALVSLLDTGYEDVDVYLVPESTYIGQLYYPQGFRFKATTHLFGWRASVDASLGFSTGLKLQGSAEPLRLGRVKKDVYAFALTGARGDLFKSLEQEAGGQPNAFPGDTRPVKARGGRKAPSAVAAASLGGPQLRASLSVLEPPSFFLSCRVALLGFIDQEVLAEVDDSGARLALSRTMGSTKLALTCQVGGKGLKARGEFVFALALDVRLQVPGTKVSLGRLKLSARLDGALSLLITANVFRVEVDGGFQWQGHSLRIPKVVLSTPLADVKQLISEATREIGEEAYELFKPFLGGFEDFMQAVDKGLVQLGKSAGQSAEELGEALKKAFRGVDSDQAARALKKAGNTAEDAARVLKKSFGATADEAARALQRAGHGVEAVGQGLAKAFSRKPAEVATALRKAGFDAEQTGKALQKVFKSSAGLAGEALKAAGFSPAETVGALRKVFGSSAEDAAKFLQKSWKQGEKEVRDILGSGGFKSADIARAAGALFSADGKAVVKEVGKAGKKAKKFLDKVF